MLRPWREGGWALGQPCCFLLVLGSALSGPRHWLTIFRKAPWGPRLLHRADTEGLSGMYLVGVFNWAITAWSWELSRNHGCGEMRFFIVLEPWGQCKHWTGVILGPLFGPRITSKSSHPKDARDQNYYKWGTETCKLRKKEREIVITFRFSLLGQL